MVSERSTNTNLVKFILSERSVKVNPAGFAPAEYSARANPAGYTFAESHAGNNRNFPGRTFFRDELETCWQKKLPV